MYLYKYFARSKQNLKHMIWQRSNVKSKVCNQNIIWKVKQCVTMAAGQTSFLKAVLFVFSYSYIQTRFKGLFFNETDLNNILIIENLQRSKLFNVVTASSGRLRPGSMGTCCPRYVSTVNMAFCSQSKKYIFICTS